jgi:hypothetical protein
VGRLGRIHRVLLSCASYNHSLLHIFNHLLTIEVSQMATAPHEKSEMDDVQDSQHKEEENSTDFETIKKTLLDCLDAVQTSGSFVCGEPLKDAPNPGLYLDGFGVMGFPPRPYKHYHD